MLFPFGTWNAVSLYCIFLHNSRSAILTLKTKAHSLIEKLLFCFCILEFESWIHLVIFLSRSLRKDSVFELQAKWASFLYFSSDLGIYISYFSFCTCLYILFFFLYYKNNNFCPILTSCTLMLFNAQLFQFILKIF